MDTFGAAFTVVMDLSERHPITNAERRNVNRVMIIVPCVDVDKFAVKLYHVRKRFTSTTFLYKHRIKLLCTPNKSRTLAQLFERGSSDISAGTAYTT